MGNYKERNDNSGKPLPDCVRKGAYEPSENHPRLRILNEEFRMRLESGFRSNKFSESTVITYAPFYRRFVEDLDRHKDDLGPPHVGPNHIKRFLRKYSRKSTSYRSMNRSILASAFKSWKEEGFIPEDPTFHIPKVKVEPGLPRPFLEEELDRLLVASNASDYIGARTMAFIYGSLSGALRFNEMRNLRWCDLQVPPIFEHSSMHVISKGNRDHNAYLNKEAYATILHFRELSIKKWGSVPLPTDYIFRSEESASTPLSRTALNDCFRKACKGAGIPDAVHHQIRHTAASFALAHGMPLALVQKYLNHVYLSTTQIYVAVSPVGACDAYFKVYSKFEVQTLAEEILAKGAAQV
jgi:site-specific recombinase XerD